MIAVSRPFAFLRRGRSWLPLAVKVVVVFWALHILYRVLIAASFGATEQLGDVALHISLLIGIALSFVLCLLLALSVRRGLAVGLALAAFLSFPLAAGFAAAEVAVHLAVSPVMHGQSTSRTLPDGTVMTIAASGDVTYRKDGKVQSVRLAPARQRLLDNAVATALANATGWYFFFFGLGALFTGMQNAARLQQAERRALELEGLARTAQLEALRYQVNPHFLFNTLNSLSSLMMAGRSAQAETMILNLSRFFRSTLAIDPTEDVTLATELELQRFYLDIEAVRFPERMIYSTDVPPALLDIRLPGLLLQPLIENAVKHGVARSNAPVRIEIIARQGAADDVVLTVRNDVAPRHGEPLADPCADVDAGTGTGLPNVTRRLTARFGAAAAVTAGCDDAGRHVVFLRFPACR